MGQARPLRRGGTRSLELGVNADPEFRRSWRLSWLWCLNEFADIDQLCISPQCGFASTEEGNLLAEDEQWAKLTRCVEVAREVWG